MEQLQIIIGLSDIKSELKQRLGLKTEINSLRLYFSVDSGMLFAHDQDKHQNAIIIAIMMQDRWSVRLKPTSHGFHLLELVTHNYVGRPQDQLNYLFKVYGFH